MEIISATNPTVIPATAEKTFDKWAIVDAHYSGGGFPMTDATVDVSKAKFNESSVEFCGETIRLNFDNLFLLAQSNQKISDWIDLTIEIVEEELINKGLK